MNALILPRRLTATLFVLLLTSLCAHAFYNPELGRWVSRDPQADIGFQELSVVSSRNLASKPFRIPVQERHVGRWDRLIKQTYMFAFNRPLGRIDPRGLDAPGCDGVPGAFESPCVLEACAEHDRCYCQNNCTAGSWLDTFKLCINECKRCNVAAAGAIFGCAIWDEGLDDPDSPNFYCGRCGVFFDVPGSDLTDPLTNPHFGHTSEANNNACHPGPPR